MIFWKASRFFASFLTVTVKIIDNLMKALYESNAVKSRNDWKEDSDANISCVLHHPLCNNQKDDIETGAKKSTMKYTQIMTAFYPSINCNGSDDYNIGRSMLRSSLQFFRKVLSWTKIWPNERFPHFKKKCTSPHMKRMQMKRGSIVDFGWPKNPRSFKKTKAWSHFYFLQWAISIQRLCPLSFLKCFKKIQQTNVSRVVSYNKYLTKQNPPRKCVYLVEYI